MVGSKRQETKMEAAEMKMLTVFTMSVTESKRGDQRGGFRRKFIYVAPRMLKMEKRKFSEKVCGCEKNKL